MSKGMPAWFGRAMGGKVSRPRREDGGRSPPNPGEVSGPQSSKYLHGVADASGKSAKKHENQSLVNTGVGLLQTIMGNTGQAAVQQGLGALESHEAQKDRAKEKKYNSEAGPFDRENAKAIMRDVPNDDGKKNGGGNWIKGAIKRPGALHRALKVPKGEKIPAKKLAKAAHSENPRIRKEAALAKTLKGFHKG